MGRTETLVVVIMMFLISFATYAAPSYAAAWLLGLSALWSTIAAFAVPLALYAVGWIAEQLSPMSTHGQPGGFIRINLGWHHLWLAPGFVVVRWMR